MVTSKLLGVRGALAAALLLAAIMLVLSAASADAAFPGQNGKIAFSKESFRNGGAGIFAINPDGSGQERLGPEYGYSPSWSANGQKLVFVAYSGEDQMEFNEDIYVMDADGSYVQRMTDTRAYESSPSFFPDGETIAFARYSNRNGADIFTIELDGTGLTKLTDDPRFYEESVAVSPDGQKIAFTSYRFSGTMGLAAEAQDSGTFAPEALGPESLAREASDPKDHTGEPQEDVEVSVMNADGTGRRDLTASPAYDVAPAFSPSGNKTPSPR